MIIEPPRDQERRITTFWYEAQRESAPWWMPMSAWWTRWRRISGRRKMRLAQDWPMRVRVEFASEAEMQQMQTYLEIVEG